MFTGAAKKSSSGSANDNEAGYLCSLVIYDNEYSCSPPSAADKSIDKHFKRISVLGDPARIASRASRYVVSALV